jgi:hypothetical protein
VHPISNIRIVSLPSFFLSAPKILLKKDTLPDITLSFGVHLYFWTVSSAAADARARAELAAHLQGCLPAGEAQALAVRVPQS